MALGACQGIVFRGRDIELGPKPHMLRPGGVTWLGVSGNTPV